MRALLVVAFACSSAPPPQQPLVNSAVTGSAASPQIDRRLADAREALRAAQTAEGPEQAYAAARRGIDELGTDYSPPGTEDDTGVHLYLAETRAKENQLASAASIAMRVLDERIHMYVRRHQR
jgi:hypothetical protein